MEKNKKRPYFFSFLRSFDCLGNIIQPGTMLAKKKKNISTLCYSISQKKNLFRTTTTKLATNCVRTHRRLAVCAKGSYVHHNEGVIQMNQLFQGYINNVGYTRKKELGYNGSEFETILCFPPNKGLYDARRMPFTVT